MKLVDRYRGALFGLAVGDALGTTVEFKPRGSFRPVTDMLGGGPFALEPGQWTDDTSMAMCLAESVARSQAFDPLDQMKRYVRWWRDGYWSSTGRCFDIGNTVSEALRRFETTAEPLAGAGDPRAAGNGSLMRLAPVPLRYARNPVEAVRLAGESSRTTHGAAEAVDACRYFAALMVGALRGDSKEQLLSGHYTPKGIDWATSPLAPAIANIANGSYTSKQERDIRASGYVVHTLEAALWAFYHSETFREGALLAVNLGEDADTTGAVFCQLAGAYHGVQEIPPDWRAVLSRSVEISQLATKLFDLATAPRGSRKHVLGLVSASPESNLNSLLENLNARVTPGASVCPNRMSDAEFEQRDFSTTCTWTDIDLGPLQHWWVDSAFKGPTWDLLAQCEVHGQPGALLVEAKAHVSELDHGGRRPSKSISTQALKNSKRIDTSVAQCQRWLRAHGVPDASVSTKAHYQLVNRLSAATVLAECGLHVILMFLGFTGDT